MPSHRASGRSRFRVVNPILPPEELSSPPTEEQPGEHESCGTGHEFSGMRVLDSSLSRVASLFEKFESLAEPFAELADELSAFCLATRDRLLGQRIKIPTYVERQVGDKCVGLHFDRTRHGDWDLYVVIESSEYMASLHEASLDAKILAAPLVEKLLNEMLSVQQARLIGLATCKDFFGAINKAEESSGGEGT